MTSTSLSKISYANPEVIVDTDWLQEHLNDKRVRIAEVDYDPSSNYTLGHIPRSVLIDWITLVYVIEVLALYSNTLQL